MGIRVWGLGSELLKGGYKEAYAREYCRGD